MYLFDICERLFARRDPAMAQHFHSALRSARDRDSMLDVGEGQAEWQIIMASTILAMLPPVLVVMLMQHWFVKGLVETEK